MRTVGAEGRDAGAPGSGVGRSTPTRPIYELSQQIPSEMPDLLLLLFLFISRP